jgi:NADPH2:quinone reductase
VTVGPVEKLVPVPDTLSDEQAAALALQGMTAHALATDAYRIGPGDTVLVHAGAGGVGLLLTQIATKLGARVISTVSSEPKAVLSRGAGAAEVLVGYEDFPSKVRALTGGRGVAAVYDGVGAATFDGSLDSLAVRATMVLFGGASGQVPPFDIQRLNKGGSLKLTRPNVDHFVLDRAEMLGRAADLFGWVADGSLQVLIGGRYPLSEAAAAQQDLAGRRTTGKLVLLP